MISATVKLTGLDKAIAQLQDMGLQLNDFSPELQNVGDYLMDFFTNDVFSSEGAVYGSPWAPLAESTLRQKRGGGGILVASGKMRTSYQLMTSTNYLIITNTATNRNGDFYAGYHQEGTSRMPQRLLMKFDQERMDQIVNRIVTSLNERIATALA